MKVLVTSDWHIHNYKDFPNRFENICSAIEQMFSYCDTHGINTILFGGDLVHKNNSTPLVVTMKVLQLFRRLERAYPTIQVIGISGNHGLGEKSILENSDNLVSWSQLLTREFSQFRCIDMKHTTLATDHGIRYTVFGIPYLEFKEDFDKALTIISDTAKLCDSEYKTLLIHQTPDFPSIKFPMDTDPNDPRYKVFDHVHCGHIHKRININPNFSIIGTPTQLKFSEGGLHIDNGFLVYDTVAKTNTFIKLDLPKMVEVKEGQPHPPNCYVKEIKDYKETTSSVSRADFNTDNSNEDIVLAFSDSQQLDQSTTDVGLEILSKIK